ncbi:hypothetical protein ACI2K4_00495 [Micromonospora sp. NPDC050397]|uniref:hypothetical protein n=1 Tax=Micromonospora sp. NPDC050397 TaxID=3364279 RepID=UPI00385143C1
MTDEEEERLWKPWRICLRDHGAREIPERRHPDGEYSLDMNTVSDEIFEACRGKWPLQPVELDPDRNPDYGRQFNDFLQCLRKLGWKVQEVGDIHSDDHGYNSYGEKPSGRDFDQDGKQCTIEVFGGQKK